MKYVTYINSLIQENVLNSETIVLFGQNISAGSCLSGLTRNIKVNPDSRIINTPNCENTLCGIGFGLMLSSVPSIYFMKQQDFLLLGVDHLVNTYNFIRREKPLASFTVMARVVDTGYEGPQSRLNNIGDFCSIARVPGYTITNADDAKQIIATHLVSPGFRILGVSQRLWNSDIIEIESIYSNDNKSLFQYTSGDDATIVCFNFALPEGLQLRDRLGDKGINSSLFSISSGTPIPWDPIITAVDKSKKLVVLDDSNSVNSVVDGFLAYAYSHCQIDTKVIVRKEYSDRNLWPNSDRLEVNYDQIIAKLT